MKRGALSCWLIGIVVAGIAIALSFYLDRAVAGFMASYQTLTMRNVMLWVSRLGDWPEHFIVGLALLGFALWRRNGKWRRVFLAMLIALAIAGLAGRAMKITTGRARPSVKSEQMWNGPSWNSKYHSFPSGHVDASVGFFVVLLLANWRVGLPLLSIPALIGFSRMYLGAHWLSDVICAAILGILSAIIVVHLLLRTVVAPVSGGPT